MKVHVLSDLHFDARPLAHVIEPVDADVVVVAGDVCEGLPVAMRFLRSTFPHQPIVTVAGNHSFYRREIEREFAAGRDVARKMTIDFLENEQVIIDGVRFVGATLWTDYCLHTSGLKMLSKMAARNGLNDHAVIRSGTGLFTPDHAEVRHVVSRAFIASALAVPHPGPTVVISHHAPSSQSVPREFRGDALTPAYASDLDEILLGQHAPALWVHGHTHTSFDYRIGDCRVVCNPHGYGRENVADFEPGLVVSI